MPRLKLRDHLQLNTSSSSSSSGSSAGSAKSPPTPELPEAAIHRQSSLDPDTVSPTQHPSPSTRRYPVSARAYKAKDYQYIASFTRSTAGFGLYPPTGAGRQIHRASAIKHHSHQQKNSHDADDGILHNTLATYHSVTGTVSTDIASSGSSALSEIHADQQSITCASSSTSCSTNATCGSAEMPISEDSEKLTTSDLCNVCVPEFGSWGINSRSNPSEIHNNYTCVFEQLRDQKKKLMAQNQLICTENLL